MEYGIAQANAVRLPLSGKSVDLVLGSPPYVDARLYLEGGKNLQIARKCAAWVEWMLDVTEEALRVSRGAVVWVAAGKTKDRNYQPACEGLMWEWWKRGGECHQYRPVYWHRVGIPGSGGDDWFRSDIEYCMCFKRPGKLAWSNNLANGHPPKWGPGGEMSYRLSSGERVNQWGRPGGRRGMGNRSPAGEAEATDRPSHKTVWGNRPSRAGKRPDGSPNGNYFNGARTNGEAIANPGNLVSITVGGGHMGHPLAHENEAPYPADLAAWFIRSLCPPGGIVLDPFSGSGTTIDAARREGRKGIGFDLRMSQCQLGRRRMENTYEPSKRKKAETQSDPDQMSLFGAVA